MPTTSMQEPTVGEEVAPPTVIGLALSGGGFRATLYHLGLIRAIRDAGQLAKVRHICSVSGGSILAAHLVVNWARYNGTAEEFDDAAREVIDFVKRDVRGRVLRRWILSIIAFPLRWLPGGRRWSRIKLLQSEYDRLFQGRTLANLLPERGAGGLRHPDLHLLCTSLTTGEPCAFSGEGFWKLSPDGKVRLIRAGTQPIALAVAASSAFPPLFPPVELTSEMLRCLPSDEFSPSVLHLADGGIYDNLGIHRLTGLVRDNLTARDLVIVSDAGAKVGWILGTSFRFILSRAVRASDLLMQRVGELAYTLMRNESFMGRGTLVQCRIAEEVTNNDDPGALAPELQRDLSNLRTDLDRFSDKEVHLLVRHGYAVGRKALEATARSQPHLLQMPARAPRAWSPAAERDADLFDSIAELVDSKKLRLRVLSLKDWATWASFLAVAAWLSIAFAIVQLYVDHNTADLKRRNTQLVRNQAALILTAEKAANLANLCELAGNLAIAPDPESAKSLGEKIAAVRLDGFEGQSLQDDINKLRVEVEAWSELTKGAGINKQPRSRGGPAPAAVKNAALGLARKCKELWLAAPAQQIGQVIDPIRNALYAQAASTTKQLAELARLRHKMQVELRSPGIGPFRFIAGSMGSLSTYLPLSDEHRRTFWSLYWGRLAMVESDEVEKAMVRFGEVLEDWDAEVAKVDEDVAKLDKLAAKLAQGADELREATGIHL
jgi:predicted acylesterase/phospholipase RssA